MLDAAAIVCANGSPLVSAVVGSAALHDRAEEREVLFETLDSRIAGGLARSGALQPVPDCPAR